MIAKVLYLNWHKLEREQRLSLPNSSCSARAAQLTLSGDFVADRPDLYDHVYTYVYADLDPHVEDTLFARLNIEDRSKFIPAKHRIRSMCVGDVVLLGDKAIVCQGMGWKMIDSVPDAFKNLEEVDEQARS